MLRFRYVERERPEVRLDASHGYLMGANDQAVAGTVALRPGKLDCASDLERALAVNIECEVQPMGRLALSTCLLQQRHERYGLLQELARNRIKLFIAKCEEWQVWDHPGSATAIAGWNEARADFTASLIASDPGDADARAAHALAKGLDAGERLAMAHARLQLHRRYESRPAGRVTLGVRATGRPGERAVAAAASAFDLIQVPLDWGTIERKEGRFDFSGAEPWIEWASQQSKVVLCGPVLDLREEALPAWLRSRAGDFEALRKAVLRYSEAVGEALGARTGMWNVASGINDSAWWPLALEQMVELVRRVEVGLRKSRNELPHMLEIPRPFAEGVGALPQAVQPSALVDALGTEGVPLDCVLAKFSMGRPGPHHLTRDLLDISACLDALRGLRKTLFVGIDVPSGPPAAGAGYWRAPWSAKSQSVWATQMFQMAMSKGHVATVLWDALADDPAESCPRGVVTSDGLPKPALDALVKARRRLGSPLGPWTPGHASRTPSPTSAPGGDAS